MPKTYELAIDETKKTISGNVQFDTPKEEVVVKVGTKSVRVTEEGWQQLVSLWGRIRQL